MPVEGRSGCRLEVEADGGLCDMRGWLGCIDTAGIGVIAGLEEEYPCCGVGEVC